MPDLWLYRNSHGKIRKIQLNYWLNVNQFIALYYEVNLMEAHLLLAADRVNVTSATKPDTPAASTSTGSQAISAPDIRVDLSAQSRQLALEAQQRDAVQSLVKPQNSTDILAQEKPLPIRDTATETPDVTTTEQAKLAATPSNADTRLTTPRAQEEPIGLTQEPQTAANSLQASAPTTQQQSANVSQSASVVTQYNISPESALGQSISIQA